MKTKKVGKKLTLTKQTIANLKNREQDAVRGGAPTTMVGCTVLYTCPRTCLTCLATCDNQNTCCGSIDACSC